MTAIHFELKVNWRKLLFDILKEMADKSSKRAKGYAAQICVLLKGYPAVTLGEAKIFPPLKILTAKMVGTYISKQNGIDDGNEGYEPVMATAELVKKKSVTKKRTAPTTAEPIAKNKRTTVGRAAPTDKNLALFTVAQHVEPISTIPAVTSRAPRCRAPKRKLALPEGSDDEIVDSIIHQVIADTTAIETGEPVIKETAEIAEKETDVVTVVEKERETTVVNDDDDNLDRAENEIARKTESFTAPKQFLKESLRSDDEDNDMSGFKQPSKIIEIEKETDKEKEIESVVAEELSLEQITDSEDTGPLSKALALTEKSSLSDEESMSIDDILK
ncbi:splicing factor 3B subunit 1-like [Dorcoceras hygrometricum]|uniref:Splicing factor 3B subunit 1-like n=1 Tax=Dorcoceras hygrometricum TaxID=472368 RepID=A0A2Z7CJP0_9LAMI|nr:splicing factor 3B subunit 1-like [Dorcoceras hygrometricum]